MERRFSIPTVLVPLAQVRLSATVSLCLSPSPFYHTRVDRRHMVLLSLCSFCSWKGFHLDPSGSDPFQPFTAIFSLDPSAPTHVTIRFENDSEVSHHCVPIHAPDSVIVTCLNICGLFFWAIF